MRSITGAQRRRFYGSRDFPPQLEKISLIVRDMFGKQRAQILADAGIEMRNTAMRMSTFEFQPLMLNNDFSKTNDNTDSFFMHVNAIADEIITRENAVLGQTLRQKIDADFANPIESLVTTIPRELKQSADFLEKALESFRAERDEECAVRTRKAWESAVNYGVAKLPKQTDLNSLSKKTKYVLGQLVNKDATKTITRVKDIFETLFLHVLDTQEPIPEPELPFFIALTAALVLSVARMLE